MLIRYADWVRPTDAAFRFLLRPVAGGFAGDAGFAPRVPAEGSRSAVESIAREVLEPESADRFLRTVHRWSGPEDVDAFGAQPYAVVQDRFLEYGWRDRLVRADLEPILAGCGLVLRHPDRTDYVLRDHHMVDVALYHYRTTGELPRAILHADRHSDWCSDAFLERRAPVQAATWWTLLGGLKRAEDGGAVVDEREVHFVSGRAVRVARMSGRDIGECAPVPSFLDPGDLSWDRVLERSEALAADWVSLDLDFFQPLPQLAVSGGMLRDARFAHLMQTARVRVFVLSPQFTNGGDKVDPWTIQGSLSSSVRLLNLLRKPGVR